MNHIHTKIKEEFKEKLTELDVFIKENLEEMNVIIESVKVMARD
jgi:hypothetical protein